MKLTLLNTLQGLKPCYDIDYEEKKKLKIGETYIANIRLVRNPHFHRKYFSLINAAWDLSPQPYRDFWKNVENFRQTIQITSGFYDLCYNPRVQDWVEIPKSISWDSMDESQFAELYSKVRSTIDTILSQHISKEDFERVLLNY